MHPRLFEKVIKYLQENYQVVQLESFLQNQTELHRNKPVATVLFDDGYKDNIEIAAPILKQYNCPASFYVVTQSIEQNIPTWTYIVDHLFQQHPGSIYLLTDFVPDVFKKLQWQSREEGAALSRKVKPWMKTLSNKQRVWALTQLQEQSKNYYLPNDMMMNWDDVKQLSSAGFHIGSHSHTHPMLASLADEQEIENELKFSCEILNERLGHHPITISYPIGSWDERVVKVAKSCGYKFGLAVEQRFFNTMKQDLFVIPRVELYNEPWWKTQLRITGVYQKVKQLVR
jgi:peptidoglycan/xylan/chitin deacetylase (PgdA/CDA1 family)